MDTGDLPVRRRLLNAHQASLHGGEWWGKACCLVSETATLL